MPTTPGKKHNWIKLHPNQFLVISIISGILAINGLLCDILALFIVCCILSVIFFLFYFYINKEDYFSSDYN
jgi:hypothetical protein